MVKASEAANAVVKYAEWCGGVHDDGCPCDDTCDCSGKPINDGVTDAVNCLRIHDDLRWVLDNVFTIARREVRRLERLADRETDVGRWGHVLRLCEKVGCVSRGVLRDNGGALDQIVERIDSDSGTGLNAITRRNISEALAAVRTETLRELASATKKVLTPESVQNLIDALQDGQ